MSAAPASRKTVGSTAPLLDAKSPSSSRNIPPKITPKDLNQGIRAPWLSSRGLLGCRARLARHAWDARAAQRVGLGHHAAGALRIEHDRRRTVAVLAGDFQRVIQALLGITHVLGRLID